MAFFVDLLTMMMSKMLAVELWLDYYKMWTV